MCLAHRVVHRGGQALAEIAVGPVHHRRRQRERVNGDADAVHRLASAVEIPVRGVERRRARLLEHDRGTLRVRAVDARLGRRALARDEIEIALGEEVRVYVDRVRPGHGRDCTIEPTSTRSASRSTSWGWGPTVRGEHRNEPSRSTSWGWGPTVRGEHIKKEPPVRLPHERFDYSAIVDRKPWRLPKGARIAVWTIVNVEEWDIEKAMARQYLPAPQGVSTVPDVPNWAWHDYGMRVGFWRLLEALAKRKLRATTAINAHVVESYEPVARAMLEAGWEFMAHGVIQGAMHLLPDQRAAIRHSIEMLTKFTGRKPKGWLGPGLTETWETLDHLAAEGIESVPDWVNDDLPYEIRTAAGRLVSVPYC